MINTQNTPYWKLLTLYDMLQNESEYFEFSTVRTPGEVNRQPYLMVLPIYQLVKIKSVCQVFEQSRFGGR